MSLDVLARWSELHADVPPVGFLLREAYPHRWLRVHSLVDAKRYASSGFEYAELRRRHHEVAADVLSDMSSCAVLFVQPCSRGLEGSGCDTGLTTPASRLGTLPAEMWDEDTGGFAEAMCIYGTAATWRVGGFDCFIDAVAEDRCRGILYNLDSGRVYAPYDGGADLIYATEFERDRARERFASWLPESGGIDD